MVQSGNSGSSVPDLQSSQAAYAFRDLPVGLKVKMTNGAVGEIIGNPADGAWLLIKYVEHPEPSQVGQEDMVFFVDVDSVA
jgi:hypothetical protein